MRSDFPLSRLFMLSPLLAFAPGKLRFVESLLSESDAPHPSDSQRIYFQYLNIFLWPQVCPDDVKEEAGDSVFYNTIIGLDGDSQETLTCKATWTSDLDDKETFMMGTLDYR